MVLGSATELGDRLTWKLKSDKYIIVFRHVPDNKFWKWNTGEQVPTELVLDLLELDEQLHETYNLHVQRQK